MFAMSTPGRAGANTLRAGRYKRTKASHALYLDVLQFYQVLGSFNVTMHRDEAKVHAASNGSLTNNN